MYSKYWQVIKDDSTKTFEVTGQVSNTNPFTNKIHAMQKAGMNISCAIPPVTNKAASKEVVKITGYVKEEGLYNRLLEEHRQITLNSFGTWEMEDETW